MSHRNLGGRGWPTNHSARRRVEPGAEDVNDGVLTIAAVWDDEPVDEDEQLAALYDGYDEWPDVQAFWEKRSGSDRKNDGS
jgi:hypothetical protein